MTLSSYQTGQRGEQIAQSILRQQGFVIQGTNWRSPNRAEKLGEIDIVALHPKSQLLVFAEVKTRKSLLHGAAIEAVDERKQQQLITLAEVYLSLHPDLQSYMVRFDVISIQYPGGGRPAEVQHVENAFGC